MDIHGIFMDTSIPCIYSVYVKSLHIQGIYKAYSRHNPNIGVPDSDVCTVFTKILLWMLFYFVCLWETILCARDMYAVVLHY